jgi:hypothetical protein
MRVEVKREKEDRECRHLLLKKEHDVVELERELAKKVYQLWLRDLSLKNERQRLTGS